MATQQRFADRVALITGASRGIGRAIARAFAAEGAAVAILSSHAENLQAVADEISAQGCRALPIVADVSSEAEVENAVSETERSVGPMDILVNSAGITGPTAPATEISLADWERVLAVNLTGTFLCSRAVLRRMIARDRQRNKAAGGMAIVNIGSIAGKISYPQRTPYASSKWGLIGLTLGLAEEAAPYGVRVNCICPGPVAGELLDGVIAARAQAMGASLEQVREKFLGITMLKRFIPAEDVAAAVLFLASTAAASITGQALDVDSGLAFSR